MENLTLPSIAITFLGFHNRLGIFYLKLPVFQWEKEGLLLLIYRTENQDSEWQSS